MSSLSYLRLPDLLSACAPLYHRDGKDLEGRKDGKFAVLTVREGAWDIYLDRGRSHAPQDVRAGPEKDRVPASPGMCCIRCLYRKTSPCKYIILHTITVSRSIGDL